jgi:hypothetical protein
VSGRTLGRGALFTVWQARLLKNVDIITLGIATDPAEGVALWRALIEKSKVPVHRAISKPLSPGSRQRARPVPSTGASA